MEKQLNQHASLAIMELATPSLEQVIEREYALGTRHFNIIPLFLAARKHLLVDVPNQLDDMKAQLKTAHGAAKRFKGQEQPLKAALPTRMPLGLHGKAPKVGGKRICFDFNMPQGCELAAIGKHCPNGCELIKGVFRVFPTMYIDISFPISPS